MPVPIVVRDLHVRSLDVDFSEVSWKVDCGAAMEDIFNYTFQLFRSESIEGPFEAISPLMEDVYLYVDAHGKPGDIFRRLKYRLRITQKRTGDTQDFGPVAQEAEPDLIAMEVRRHTALLMREFTGRRCWLLPVRTFGQRCSCYDAVLQKKRRSGCQTCFDTTFTQGYLHPIETWVQFDPSAKTEQNSPYGRLQQDNTTARLPYAPLVKPNDVLVEAENVRWRVVKVATTERLRAPLHQEIQLHRIPSSDMEYAVPIHLDRALRDLWLSPHRNFSNPQTLEAYVAGELPDALGLYRY